MDMEVSTCFGFLNTKFYVFVSGQNVAKYSSEKLAGIVIDSEDFKKNEYKDALRKGFFRIDTDLLNGKTQNYQN